MYSKFLTSSKYLKLQKCIVNDYEKIIKWFQRQQLAQIFKLAMDASDIGGLQFKSSHWQLWLCIRLHLKETMKKKLHWTAQINMIFDLILRISNKN